MIFCSVLEFDARLHLLWFWLRICSATTTWWLRTQSDLLIPRANLATCLCWAEWNRSHKHRSVPLLVMMGPAVRRAFPDAPGGGLASSRLRRRSQICRLHHNTSVLADVTSRHSLADLRAGGLPALAGCSRPCGKVWWRSAGTLWTSFGVGAWRNGRPRRKNAPSDSRRSRRLSSVGLYCNCRKHTDGLLVMLEYWGGGTLAFIWNEPFWRAWMDNESLLWFIESASRRRNKMTDYRKKRS